ANVTLGAMGALALFLAMLKWLPGGGLWSRMVLESAVTSHAGGVRALHQDDADHATGENLLGSTGTAATALRPSGQVQIGGKRYEARLQLGLAEAGARVRVVRVGEFELEVEVLS
ncbi:MAG TPA: NfeD family protein, partial [Luteolibacter sp.]|nr:NfeD family protein [Luteolibacter sp.]